MVLIRLQYMGDCTKILKTEALFPRDYKGCNKTLYLSHFLNFYVYYETHFWLLQHKAR